MAGIQGRISCLMWGRAERAERLPQELPVTTAKSRRHKRPTAQLLTTTQAQPKAAQAQHRAQNLARHRRQRGNPRRIRPVGLTTNPRTARRGGRGAEDRPPREIDGVHAPDGDARPFGALRKRIPAQLHCVLLRCPRRHPCRCRRDAELDRPLQPTVTRAMSIVDPMRRRSPARSGWATWKPPVSTSRERPEDSSPESNDTASRDRAAHEESTWSDPPPRSSHVTAAVMSQQRSCQGGLIERLSDPPAGAP